MNKKIILAALAVAFSLQTGATGAAETEAAGNKELKLKDIVGKPKFSGYAIGSYNATFRDGDDSNGFSLRMVRLMMVGRILGDFEYKVQGQINGNTGTYGESPRLVDMSLEWLRHKEFKVKVGQFKRPFTFENPMNPIDVGFASYNQNVSCLSGFSDRTGEQSSNGRDIGIQFSGDLLPNASGHRLLHYEVGLFNGQGINQKDVNNQKDLIGGIWVSPVKGLRFGAFGWVGSYARNGKWTEDGVEKSGVRKVGRHRYAISAEYKNDDWQIRSEYIHNTGGAFATTTNTKANQSDCTINEALGNKADGAYVSAIAPVIKGKLRAKASYDFYRRSGNWATSKTIYKAGLNYLLCRNLEFQAEYSFVNDRNLAKHNYSMADVQFCVRF